jgi:hypothetical protein
MPLDFENKDVAFTETEKSFPDIRKVMKPSSPLQLKRSDSLTASQRNSHLPSVANRRFHWINDFQSLFKIGFVILFDFVQRQYRVSLRASGWIANDGSLILRQHNRRGP